VKVHTTVVSWSS